MIITVSNCIYVPFIRRVDAAMAEGVKKYGYQDYLRKADPFFYAIDKLGHAQNHLCDFVTDPYYKEDSLGHAAADIMIAMELLDLIKTVKDPNDPIPDMGIE